MEVVIVGAGHAGLSASFCLRQDGREHVVLERGRIGETWRSQRWDSFTLNTLNAMNAPPGFPYDGPHPDGFETAGELARRLEEYARRFELPVRGGTEVLSVRRDDGEGFLLRLCSDARGEETLRCRNVIAASGVLNVPKRPGFSARVPEGIARLHACEYRNPVSLPPGAVVIAGSAQSGCQIAEDLLAAGREVYLCTGAASRVPRRYRGRDILEWWMDMGVMDVPYEAVRGTPIPRTPQPQISGLGRHGHSVSLQWLARRGAVILGRALDVDGGCLLLAADAADNVRFADAFSRRVKDDVDAFIARSGAHAHPPDADDADADDPDAACASSLARLDLREARVGAIIWATGFTGDFRWIELPVLDADGAPVHTQGCTAVPGLYFLGFPWLRARKSGILYGMGADARFIADRIAERSREMMKSSRNSRDDDATDQAGGSAL